MKLRLLLGFALLLALPVLSQPPASSVRWRSDFPAARQEALSTGKPLFVVLRCER